MTRELVPIKTVVTMRREWSCRIWPVSRGRELVFSEMTWRRRERAAWLKKGRPAPPWVFASVSGTRLDPSNVRKAFDRVLSAAQVHQRGPHQMRHTCASQLLQHGAAITYVARQLGHREASTTLRIYAHWLPDVSRTRRGRFVGWDATVCNPRATSGRRGRLEKRAKCFGVSGEPGGNRTPNPQIKSPLRSSKTPEILTIVRERCAERARAMQMTAAPAQPDRQCHGEVGVP
jgi:hypothetical protein